jgi:hypothetical protein
LQLVRRNLEHGGEKDETKNKMVSTVKMVGNGNDEDEDNGIGTERESTATIC